MAQHSKQQRLARERFERDIRNAIFEHVGRQAQMDTPGSDRDKNMHVIANAAAQLASQIEHAVRRNWRVSERPRSERSLG